jgi:hypothetical protein
MLKRILTAPFVWILGAWIAFIEWLWNPLLAFIRSLTRWPIFRVIERGVSKLPPYPALGLFIIPMIVLLPIKLVGLYFLAHGKKFLGLLAFLAGKVLGTALAAWIYSLTEPALSKLTWFVALRSWFFGLKAKLYERIRTSITYRFARRKIQTLRSSVRQWFA